MTSAQLKIRTANWCQERERMLGVRCAVFVDEQGFPAALESDENDLSALHILAEFDGTAVATARCTVEGQIGRMAVLPTFRNRGIGGILLRTLVHRAAARGITKVYLNAQVPALRFYSHYGFVATGPRFMDHGVEHCRMEYRTEAIIE